MPIKRKFGTQTNYPTNLYSDHKTPTTLVLDYHWAKLNLKKRWTWERYVRLCRFLEYTPWELASLVQIPHFRIKPYHKDNPPLRVTRNEALILTLIEAYLLAGWTDDVIENPFPKMATGTAAAEAASVDNKQPTDEQPCTPLKS